MMSETSGCDAWELRVYWSVVQGDYVVKSVVKNSWEKKDEDKYNIDEKDK